jgi:cyclomaltodextrinase
VLSKAEPTPYRADHGVFGVPGDLSPWDIRFDPADRAHLDSVGNGRARLRLWAEPELGEAQMVVRSFEGVLAYPMDRVFAGDRFTFWEVVVGPFDHPVDYSFALRAGDGTGVYLAPSGVTNAIERLDRWTLVIPEEMNVPDWSQGMVVYQIFPDRFARSDSASAEGIDPWGSEPTSTGFQGGDLEGVTSRLGYLESLGVDALYLNPIFASPSNHRFDAVDYYQVDPLLGGNEDLERLVTESHKRGMKVILDSSFNHVHPSFFAFQDLMRNGPESPYWSWFVVSEWPFEIRYRPDLVANAGIHPLERWEHEIGIPARAVDGPGPAIELPYEAWYDVATMPRVDLANPEARRYMLDVATYWPREYGIDGWRMDVVRYVDPDFWVDMRREVRSVSADLYLLAEVWGDASDWLQGDRFDATMNYTFRELCLRFFARETMDGAALTDGLARLWAQYPWTVTLANHNLLGSHDRARYLTECGGEVWRAVLTAVFQMTFPGAPGIYYGDEVGMEGEDDPGCRAAMDWGSEWADHPIYSAYQSLARLRRREPTLVTGEWRPIVGSDGIVAYSRETEGRRLVVVINRGPDSADVSDTSCQEVVWGEASVEGGRVMLGPKSAAILV